MITNLISPNLFGEFKLRDHMRYCGPNTPLEKYVSNLPFLLKRYDSGYMIDARLIEFNKPIYEPCMHLDWNCLMHDIYYWIGEQKPELQKGIQRVADRNLIDALSGLINKTKPGDPEHDDSLIVRKIIQTKINVEKRTGKNRHICCVVS